MCSIIMNQNKTLTHNEHERTADRRLYGGDSKTYGQIFSC